jgi:membrane protease YdiL (CAAX protease family)
MAIGKLRACGAAGHKGTAETLGQSRRHAMKHWVTRYPILSYALVAYAVSWSVSVPLALQATGVLDTRLPLSLHYLTAFGPATAAFVVARLLRQPSAGVERGQPTSRTREIRWWAVGFGSPLIFFIAAALIARIGGQNAPTWNSLGRVHFLPELGVMAWGLWFLTSGIGEEFGWRGFALPRLQRTHSAVTSSLLVAIVWAGWHLPFFFYIPSYSAMGVRVLPGFFLGLFAGSIVLTWLYNSSGGSVLAVALWHASFNFVTASPYGGGFVPALTSMLVITWAVALMCRHDWATLARRARSVRATREEKARVLPGDALIHEAIASLTHAVTIARVPDDVWPWLVQMGAGNRAGWYSYDVVDNGGRPSAVRIIPELQRLKVGTVFPALPGATDGFLVAGFDPKTFLILEGKAPDGARLVSWAFVLEPAGRGATRLIVRVRGGRGYRFRGLPWWLTKRIIPIVHFVMQRKQLLEIARRAEFCGTPGLIDGSAAA